MILIFCYDLVVVNKTNRPITCSYYHFMIYSFQAIFLSRQPRSTRSGLFALWQQKRACPKASSLISCNIFSVRCFHTLCICADILQSRIDVAVTEQCLDLTDIHATFRQTRGKCSPEPMRMYVRHTIFSLATNSGWSLCHMRCSLGVISTISSIHEASFISL